MTVQAVADVLAGACLISGALLSLAAGVGLLRFPDLLSRMHAATKPQVLGLLLILLGTALRLPNVVDITTLVLVGIFQLVTAPVAAHMVGRAVYRARQVRRDLLVMDELAGDRADDAGSGPGDRFGFQPGPRPDPPLHD
jgi:multicomponent Na+:H+ antiporter subunit G